MHILLDLSWMKPGCKGGIETQSRAFLYTLLEIDYSNTYTVCLPSEVRFDFDFAGHQNFKIINSDGPAYFAYRLLEKVGLSRASSGQKVIAGHQIDCEIAITMSGYTNPDLYSLPTVLVVPDIQHEFFPQYFSVQELDSRKSAFTTSIGKAQLICAISNFTKQTLISKLNVNPEKVYVTPLAADPQIIKPIPASVQAQTLNKYGLKPGYLFYPAFTWPHKNHINLLRAMRLLRDQHGLRPELVCTGTPKDAQSEIESVIQQLNLTDQVHFLGYVPQVEMGSFYRNAAALVFPSLFEGFGMPVLEAMACGCPVVCSRSTSLPEVGGDAALYIDPEDPGDLANGLLLLLNQPDFRESMIAKGLEQAKGFSWLRFTLQILQQAFCATNPQGLPDVDSWDAPEWQAVLFSNQSGRNPTTFMSKLVSAQRSKVLGCLETSADACRRRKWAKSDLFGFCAFLLSPRIVFISRIFPMWRDFFRRVRSKLAG